MVSTRCVAIFVGLLGTMGAFGNPYEDPNQVPKDRVGMIKKTRLQVVSPAMLAQEARTVLRVDIDWLPGSDSYAMGAVIREDSGTDALYARARVRDPHGSYQARLQSHTRAAEVFYDSVGTGKEFRRLSRGFSFRFPYYPGEYTFTLTAENPLTGEMEVVLNTTIDSATALQPAAGNNLEVDVRRLKDANLSPYAVLNVYAEGYAANNKSAFWDHARKVVDAFERKSLPMLPHLQINAVFAPSAERLGTAADLGEEGMNRDSFLGLYFPYWNPFGRWYHVVYPTNYHQFRDGLGSVPYDYAIILIDSADYWGVGNFKELTAIPARHSSFTYLLMHELGHYFGLNEEYSGGGRTELEFAPGIEEPWSQNITFQTDKDRIKWSDLIADQTPVPTSAGYWRNAQTGPWGAYVGGYADSEPRSTTHKPGLSCTMDRSDMFCPVCSQAIKDRIEHDTGIEFL